MRFMHCNTILFINRNNKISYECLCVKMQDISIQKLLGDLIRLLKILWCTTSLNSKKKNIRNHAHEIASQTAKRICINWYYSSLSSNDDYQKPLANSLVFIGDQIVNLYLNHFLIWVGCKVVGFYILYVGRLMTQQ